MLYYSTIFLSLDLRHLYLCNLIYTDAKMILCQCIKEKKKKKEHHVNCKKINVNFNIMEFNESNLKTDNMSLANKNAKRRN